ncbi:MAG: DUF882 domain-containing protein [Pseudomonadota bacterium]
MSAPSLSRRSFIRGVAVSASSLPLLPSLAQATVSPLIATRFADIGQTNLWVRVASRDEEINVPFRTADSLLITEGVRALSWIWRDWRDDDYAVWIDYRLFDILAYVQTRATLEDDAPRRLVLTSGYRTSSRNALIEGAARQSQHIYGRAGDLWFDGLEHGRVATLAEAAGAAGVGRYKTFTHVDVGKEGRRWRRDFSRS